VYGLSQLRRRLEAGVSSQALTAVILPLCVGVAAGVFVVDAFDPRLVPVVIVGSLVGIAAFVRSDWGLLALVFVVYTRLSNVLVRAHGLPSIAKIFIPLLVLIILVRWLVHKEQPGSWKRLFIALGLYGLIGIISLLHATDPDLTQTALWVFVKDSIVAFVVVVLMKDAVTFRRVAWALLAGGILLGSIATFQYLTGTFENTYLGFGKATVQNIVSGSGQSGYRLGGPGLGANAFGRYLLLVVPFALDRLLTEKQLLLRLLAGWALSTCVLSIFFTFSRGSFLALVVVLFVMLARRLPMVALVPVMVVITLALLQLSSTQFKDRLSELTKLLPGSTDSAAEKDASLRGRLSENISAIKMFYDEPIWGVGLGNYNIHYRRYAREVGLDGRKENRSAHSLYLETAAELGLVGLAWLVALQWLAFDGLWRARTGFLAQGMPGHASMCEATGVAIIGYLITGLFLHVSHPRLFWLMYGIAFAIPACVPRPSTRPEQPHH
jgi:O-antigen ligase